MAMPCMLVYTGGFFDGSSAASEQSREYLMTILAQKGAALSEGIKDAELERILDRDRATPAEEQDTDPPGQVTPAF